MTSAVPQDDLSGLLARLAELDTCALSDALDFLELPGATFGIRPLWPAGKIVGAAITVQAGPRTDTQPAFHLNAPAIDSAGSSDVLVISNEGRVDVSCWGDIVSHAARARGASGVVIDGACRDIDASAAIGFPVYGRAVVPISARGRIVQKSFNEPVQMAGVTVHPGDLVLADGSGVVFIPRGRAAEVIGLAERVVHRELRMIEAVNDGASVTEVMHDSQFAAIAQQS
jgi:4-hydroxy-4-methyl-2-oxoglutarate aldolase